MADVTEIPPDESPRSGTAAPPLPPSPAQIGNYRIIELIGAGGMGEVYKAEQRQPIVRIVALKLIKLGLDTREVIARFQAERQALARMDHPNVAKVLDAGADPVGRPYFVMEFVPGTPITRFADDHRLGLPERLQLFTQACDAIAHAHTKAILHRDIKASNVLAYLLDGRPCVKVIDFGVAKALTRDRLGNDAYNTVSGQMIGTYESMSPEQADGSPDIDTRSDVYSLGVLLYELLAGLPPHDLREIGRSSDLDIRRIIREVEPPRPSTRLSLMGDSASAIARARQTRVEHLCRQLGRELEWIPLMAMRKQRSRRYASALQLAQDIESYLTDRPLLAGPDSRTYRFVKFVHKRKVPLAALASFLLVVISLTGWYIRSLRAQQRETEAALIQARDQQDLAERARDFLVKTLQLQDPLRGGRQDISVSQAMQELIQQLDRGELSDQPALQASLLDAIASILTNGGEPQRALGLAQRALEINRRLHTKDHPDLATSLNILGRVQLTLGQVDQAEMLFRQALQMRRRLFPGDHADTAQSLNNLASARRAAGQPADAVPLLTEAIEMLGRLRPGDHAELALSVANLGRTRVELNQPADAEPLLRKALEMYQRIYRADHADIAATLCDIGGVELEVGKAADAESRFARAVEIRQRLWPEGHAESADALVYLGVSRLAQSRPADAEPVLDQALRMYKRLFNSDNASTATAMYDLAQAKLQLHRTSEAEPLLREALRMQRSLLGPLDPNILKTATSLTILLDSTARPADAGALREEFKIGKP